ncbi:MAG TPA: ferrochelatase [Acidimicrobiales bacterium]|nr:ferrochelatase [Acidimicrobiales bacterium]
MTERPTGVLVMAHGTPGTPEEIESFYTSIRRGRPPTPELLADLVGRYQAIGGTSPLRQHTEAQVQGLAATLEAAAPGRFVVRYGAKHTEPSIEAGMAELAQAGVARVVGLVLTPHQSAAGTGQYLDRAARAASSVTPPIELLPVPSWFRTPGFASILAQRVQDSLASLPEAVRADAEVIFTAHSVPSRAVHENDPYPEEVTESAKDIAALAGLGHWRVAWQSAGRTADVWLGPDLLDEIRTIAAEGTAAVVVCPVGFVADHLEVLFDLDIEAAAVAASVGIGFARTASLNDDPRFLTVLAEAVLAEAVLADAVSAAASSDRGAKSPAP